MISHTSCMVHDAVGITAKELDIISGMYGRKNECKFTHYTMLLPKPLNPYSSLLVVYRSSLLLQRAPSCSTLGAAPYPSSSRYTWAQAGHCGCRISSLLLNHPHAPPGSPPACCRIIAADPNACVACSYLQLGTHECSEGDDGASTMTMNTGTSRCVTVW